MGWSKRLAAGLAAALVASVSLAQEAFPLRSLDALAASDLAQTRVQKKTAKDGDLFFIPGPDGGARAEAVYTGQSRALPPQKQAFILTFAASSVGNDGYGALFDREYLFRSGAKDFWLPVQGQVAAYFTTELKAGQTVMLYLRNAGGYRTGGAWNWVFLVEEFEGPAGSSGRDAPPAAKPVPSGPRQQT